MAIVSRTFSFGCAIIYKKLISSKIKGGPIMEDNELQREIDLTRKAIKTDTYPMSIGELANLYKDGDLNINPIYQRLFRWDIAQQSALIESILLSIPVPPIYVYQDSTGRWNLIDGLQRLSTIFKFMGILKENSTEDGLIGEDNTTTPEALVGTKFLKSLKGKYWNDEISEVSFDEVQRRLVKRAKIPIIIIDQSSDDFAQYEMFQRLNTGGSHLSPQEIRNCILTQKDANAYKFFKKLSDYDNFQKSLPISEREVQSQGYMELVIKYFVIKYASLDSVSDSDNYHETLTNEILKIIGSKKIDYVKDAEEFKKIFTLITDCFDENAFKKYDGNRNTGGVLVGAYEAIIPGIIDNYESYFKDEDKLLDKVHKIFANQEYCDANKRGMRPVARMKTLVKFSRRFFLQDESKNVGESI